ncbi:hypothetical protein CA598_25920 [Paenibacillus sp. VTT E-133291]|nr:hypothetical protein CA598_25920 [Paenibacillus sp. VTT E-133291]
MAISLRIIKAMNQEANPKKNMFDQTYKRRFLGYSFKGCSSEGELPNKQPTVNERNQVFLPLYTQIL